MNKKISIVYKGVPIEVIRGSNYAYVGARIFTSALSAKRHISKVIKVLDGDINEVRRFYSIF